MNYFRLNANQVVMAIAFIILVSWYGQMDVADLLESC